MSNRSGKRFRDQHYKMLARIDGHYCLICKGEGITRAPPEHPLEIDHARTDLLESHPKRWEYDVTALLCRSCNLSLRHKAVEEHIRILRLYRARNVRARASESGSAFEHLVTGDATIMDRVDFNQGSPEMSSKSYYEPNFEKFVFKRVSEHTTYPENNLLDEFFALTKCSQTTSKRYLKGYCSRDGFYKRIKIDGEWHIAFNYSPREKKGD